MRTDPCKVLYARVKPELHEAALRAAAATGEPINALVARAVRQEVERIRWDEECRQRTLWDGSQPEQGGPMQH